VLASEVDTLDRGTVNIFDFFKISNFSENSLALAASSAVQLLHQNIASWDQFRAAKLVR
jgi:hypothetical protein